MVTERVDIVIKERGSRTVKRSLDDVGAASKRAARNVLSLNRAFEGLGSAIIAGGVLVGLGKTVNVLSTFSQSLSTVQAITQTTGQEFQLLSKEAQRLGATTRFTATQSADAMVNLARAGLDVNQILGATNKTLNLAQAGAIDLSTAADITVKVMRQMGLEVKDLDRVVDVLTKTANRSSQNVTELFDAFRFAGVAANQFGIQIEELSASIAVLANRGIVGTIGGTGLRRLIARLQSPIGPFRKELQRLGVDLDSISPKIHGISGAIDNLVKSGFNVDDAIRFLGDRAGPIFQALSGATDEVRALNKALGNSEGFARSVARTMDDNLNGALLALASSLSNLVIQLGKAGIESLLENIVRGLTEIFRTIGAAIPPIAAFLKNFAVLAAIAFAPKLIVGFGVALTLLIGKIRAVGSALLLLAATNPFTAALAGIALLITGFQHLNDAMVVNQQTGATLGDVFTAMFENVPNILGNVQRGFNVAFNAIRQTITGATDFIELKFSDIPRGLAIALDAAIGVVAAFARAAVTIFTNLGSTIENIFKNSFNSIVKLFGGEFKLELSKEAQGIGGVIAQSFADGFNGSTVLQDALNNVLKRADDIARTRASGQLDETGAFNAGNVNKRIQANNALAASNAAAGTSFASLIQKLQQENELLRLNSSERTIRQQILQFEEQLGRRLTENEQAQVTALTQQNQQLKLQSQILQELNGPREQLANRQQALNTLFQEGKISADQFNQAMRDLNVQATALNNSIGGGLANGLARIAQNLNNVGRQVSDFVVNAFNQLTDAIVEFAKTGEFNVQKFFSSLFEQLLRLALNQIFAMLVQGFLGGGGLFGGGGGFGGLLGFQNGGQFTVAGNGGIDSRVVAFRATPGEQVTVQRPDQVRAQEKAMNSGGVSQPQDVSIVNQIDPAGFINSLDSAQGTRVILNIIRNNSSAVSRVLQR